MLHEDITLLELLWGWSWRRRLWAEALPAVADWCSWHNAQRRTGCTAVHDAQDGCGGSSDGSEWVPVAFISFLHGYCRGGTCFVIQVSEIICQSCIIISFVKTYFFLLFSQENLYFLNQISPKDILETVWTLNISALLMTAPHMSSHQAKLDLFKLFLVYVISFSKF